MIVDSLLRVFDFIDHVIITFPAFITDCVCAISGNVLVELEAVVGFEFELLLEFFIVPVIVTIVLMVRKIIRVSSWFRFLFSGDGG